VQSAFLLYRANVFWASGEAAFLLLPNLIMIFNLG
jgi:hypothetical protein